MSEFQNYFPEANLQSSNTDTGYNDQSSLAQKRFLQAVFQPDDFRQNVQQFQEFRGGCRNQSQFHNRSRFNPDRAARLNEYRRSIRRQKNASFRGSDCNSGRFNSGQNQYGSDANYNYIQSLVRQGVIPGRVLNQYVNAQRNPNFLAQPNRSNWDYSTRNPGYQPNNWDYSGRNPGCQSNNWNNRFVQPDYRTRYFPQHRNQFTQPFYQNGRNSNLGNVIKNVLITSLLSRSGVPFYQNRYTPYGYGSNFYRPNGYGRGQNIGGNIARIAIPMIINQIGRGQRGYW